MEMIHEPKLLERLVSLAQPDGGWGYRDGQPGHLEPTCYALLALAAEPQKYATTIANGLRSLQSHAQADGMTTIEKRILARAEQHAQIRAAIASGDYTSALRQKPTATARQRWDKAIESAVAKCG